MENDNEKVVDVVAKLREMDYSDGCQHLADRILAAHNHELKEASKHSCEYATERHGCTVEDKEIKRITELQKIVAEKDEKIAWLKRGISQMDINCNRLKERIALLEKALKPVIEINLEGLTKFEGIDCEKLLTAIVADAQQIMKEGENK